MKKIGFILICVFLVASLGGCAGSENSEDVTTVSVDKNGKVTGTIVEALDKDYYDIDELKTMINTDIQQYNTEAGEEKITLDSSDITSEKAVVKMTYADAENYAAFNDMIFFAGTVTEAKEAGYEIESSRLKGIDETTDVESLLTDSTMRIIIMEEPVQIHTFGNIKAMSDEMTLVNKKEAVAAENEDAQLHMILFK